MRMRIVRLGKAYGLLIPGAMIEASGLTEEVELEAHEGVVVVRSAGRVRAGWDAAFEGVADARTDALFDSAGATSDWDTTEWEW